MKTALPALDRAEFERQLAGAGWELEPAVSDRLFVHYCELRRWNERFSLVGPGTADDPVGRHYVESLAGLSFLREDDRVLVDCGSGAGFPGWIMAAAHPDLDVTLVESKRKKWSFLEMASQKAALPCTCLNARVSAVIPEGFPPQVDLILMRAVRLERREVSAMISRLSDHGRFLVWAGEEVPLPMEGLSVTREVPTGSSHWRRILEIVRKNQENPT